VETPIQARVEVAKTDRRTIAALGNLLLKNYYIQ
jgi:hypothetical protein